MAYVMTLKQGEDFYVNDVRFVLTEIVSSAAVKIQRDSDGKLFQMADGEVHQIAPLTSAFVGTRGSTTAASMAVSAPKSVSIDPGVSVSRERRPHKDPKFKLRRFPASSRVM